MRWRVLFGLFGGGRENGRRYAAILGGKINMGPAPPPKVRKRRGGTGQIEPRRVGPRGAPSKPPGTPPGNAGK
jgi:hypothetical protein